LRRSREIETDGYFRYAIAALWLMAIVAIAPVDALAQGMMESVPKASSSSSGWASPDMTLSAPKAAASPLPKFSNELTLPSANSQQEASIPRAPKSDNTKIIPVIPPNQEVLVLPEASHNFLGRWGGKLHLVNKYGDFDAPERSEVGLTFGERNGQVVMATTVYGSADSQVLKTEATAEGPYKVRLVVSGLDISEQPAVRHIEKMTMELAANDEVQCRKRVDFYVSGFTEPVAEAVYEGTLKPLTAREQEKLGAAILRSGAVPRARIDQGNPPPMQPLE
jgi:hypothetical protein